MAIINQLNEGDAPPPQATGVNPKLPNETPTQQQSQQPASKKKYIIGFFVTLMLTAGIGIGVFLVQNQQIFKSSASDSVEWCASFNCPNGDTNGDGQCRSGDEGLVFLGYGDDKNCLPPECGQIDFYCDGSPGDWDEYCGHDFIGNFPNCGGGSSTPPPTPGPTQCNDSCDSDSQCRSINTLYVCDTTTQTCRHRLYPEQTNCQPICNSSCLSDTACSNINPDWTCYGEVIRGNTPVEQLTQSTPGNCRSTSNLESTTCEGTTSIVTPSPSPSPPGTPSTDINAQCLNVNIYDLNWNVLSPTQLSQLQPGDTIRLGVLGYSSDTGITMARFTVNSQIYPATQQKRAGTEEYYMDYTIPQPQTGQSQVTFTIKAELYHAGLDQWF